MLSFLRGDTEVGFYSAAYRLTDALVFIPTVITTSTFPLMSKYFKDSFDSFSFAYARTFKYLFATGLLIAVVVTFASDKIIYIVYGPEYQKLSNCTTNPYLDNSNYVYNYPYQLPHVFRAEISK